MTPDQSLELIQRMIAQAKRSFFKMNYYFLLWGGLLFLAGIGEFVLDEVVRTSMPWIVWPIVGVVGGIMASLHGSRQGRMIGVATFTDRLYQWLWTGFVITLVLVIVASVERHVNPGPYIMLLTGLPTFVTGMVMRFKPLIFGGICFWVLGMFAFHVPDAYGSLLFSVAILLGYLIPGVMLKRQEDGLRTA